MEHKPVKQKNPFTGRTERYDKFGPRAAPRGPVRLPEALDKSVADIMAATGLGYSAIVIRALARYVDWHYKRTEYMEEQRPAVIEHVIARDKPDPDPF